MHEQAVFILKCLPLMMLFLVFNVANDNIDVFRIHGESSIAVLPIEILKGMALGLSPSAV